MSFIELVIMEKLAIKESTCRYQVSVPNSDVNPNFFPDNDDPSKYYQKPTFEEKQRFSHV
jgi:hypothetical protein